MLSLEKRLCVFCDSLLTKENRSKEHVIPKWLSGFLDISKEKIQPTHISSNGSPISIRNHTLTGLLAGQVCEECNSGWMSKLEEEAIPILKPLIKGERVVVELKDKERQIVGRWTAKTAFALNSSANYFKNIPNNHYKYISKHIDSLPPKVSSFGQQHHGTRPFYWIQSPTWIILGQSNSITQISENLKIHSYKISFQFGKLMSLLSYFPIENIYPVLWRGIHVPLIPKSGKCASYDKKKFSWNDSDKALVEFHIGLQAFIEEKHKPQK